MMNTSPVNFKKVALATGLCLVVSAALAQERVFFKSPADGATVTSPVRVKFGLEGMKIGTLGDMTNKTGHHHMIINGGVIASGESIPADEKHVHFGQGQTDAEIALPNGKHTLTMQFGNGAHQSYGPKMSKTITVTVVSAAK